MKRPCGYARLSMTTDDSVSIAGQKSMIYAEAERHAWPEPVIFTDDGISGSKDIKRPGRDEMERRLGEGEFTALIVKSVDRLARSASDFLRIAALCKKNGTALVVSDLGIDTTTPWGEMILGILAQIAQFEAALIAQRMLVSNAERIKMGRAIGGPVPYGFTNVKAEHGTYRRVDLAQQRVIMRMIEELQGGSSLRAIAARLQADGTPSPRGRWESSSISRILSNPALAGMLRRHGDLVRGPDGMPRVDEDAQILTLSEWAHLQAVLEERLSGPRTSIESAERLLLDGIVQCASCLHLMRRGTAKGKYENYLCYNPDCTQRGAVSVLSLDEYVIDRFLLQAGDRQLHMRPRIGSGNEPETVRLVRVQIDDTMAMLSSAPVDQIPIFAERLVALRRAEEAARIAAKDEPVAEWVPSGLTVAEAWRACEDKASKRSLLARSGILRVLVKKGRMPVDEKVTVKIADGFEPMSTGMTPHQI